MFTLNDLLSRGVKCVGFSIVNVVKEDGDLVKVFESEDITEVPYKYGSKELAYIYSQKNVTYYEVNE